MTTATTARCVRCGQRPRTATPYLCDSCAADPATRREVANAEAVCPPDDVISMRRFVIERFGWRGGWGAAHPWKDDGAR